MIISASRRTDIPAFYSEWMIRRLREGNVLFPYPRTTERMGAVRLSPEHVDCIVFWTKDCAPMLDRLPEIDAMGYRYYFSFSVTPYGPDTERGLPDKERVMETFRRLSDRIGPDRVDWRYDPVIISPRYPVEWHLEQFGRMCGVLGAHTRRCIMNFLRVYRHIRTRYREPEEEELLRAARGLGKIAAEHRLPLMGCTGIPDLEAYGIGRCACIDKAKIEAVTGWPIRARKDPGQPAGCSCVQSVDIGAYDSCAHGCDYCYAVTGGDRACGRMAEHDPASPLLIGRPGGTEIIHDRTTPSQREEQFRLF